MCTTLLYFNLPLGLVLLIDATLEGGLCGAFRDCRTIRDVLCRSPQPIRPPAKPACNQLSAPRRTAPQLDAQHVKERVPLRVVYGAILLSFVGAEPHIKRCRQPLRTRIFLE